MTGEWFTADQVAERFGVKPVTVRSWIRAGHLEAFSSPGGRTYRIKESDIQAFVADGYERTAANAA